MKDIKKIEREIARRKKQAGDYEALAQTEQKTAAEIEERRRGLLLRSADGDDDATAELRSLGEELLRAQQRARDAIETGAQIGAALEQLEDALRLARRDAYRDSLRDLAAAHVADFEVIARRVDELATVFERCFDRARRITEVAGQAEVRLPPLIPHEGAPSRDYAGLYLLHQVAPFSALPRVGAWARGMFAEGSLPDVLREIFGEVFRHEPAEAPTPKPAESEVVVNG